MKYFNKDGVQYTIDGDEELADSYFQKAVTQMFQLELMNVNNLPQVQSVRTFDDGTVIQCSITYSIKQTLIITPIEKDIPEGKEEEKEEELKKRYVDTVVPILVVTSDYYVSPHYTPNVEILGFIICTSGTFEGPYIYCSNASEYSYQEIYLTKYKQELSNSIPNNTFLGSIDNYDLFYLKPTGERTGYGGSTGYEKEDFYDPRWQTAYNVVVYLPIAAENKAKFISFYSPTDALGQVTEAYLYLNQQEHELSELASGYHRIPRGLNYYNTGSEIAVTGIGSFWTFDGGQPKGRACIYIGPNTQNEPAVTFITEASKIPEEIYANIRGEVFMGVLRTYIKE